MGKDLIYITFWITETYEEKISEIFWKGNKDKIVSLIALIF